MMIGPLVCGPLLFFCGNGVHSGGNHYSMEVRGRERVLLHCVPSHPIATPFQGYTVLMLIGAAVSICSMLVVVRIGSK